ncbi:MAG: lipid A deacylase LpxR family protein [Candidatus Fonsibacter sp.]
MRQSILLLFILLVTSPVFANCKADEEVNFRNYNFRIENDYFNNEDSNYTSGVILSGVTNDFKENIKNECLPTIARLHGKILSFINADLFKKQTNHSKNMYFNISQLMYTPVDDKTQTVIKDDRPYAGLLSLGIGINERNRDQIKNIQILNTKELTLGIIGPASFARQTQNFVHDRFNVYQAQGWNHQLDNEPAIMYMLERKIKSDLQQNSYTPGVSKDLIKFYGLKVGNIETSLNLGLEGRYGLNIPNDFGSTPSYPGCDNTAPTSESLETCTDKGELMLPIPLGAHLFALAELKAVAYDFSLDGNIFGNNHHVHREPFVGLIAVGVSSLIPVPGNKNLKLTLTQYIQSKQFKEQKNADKFVSFTLGLDF